MRQMQSHLITTSSITSKHVKMVLALWLRHEDKFGTAVHVVKKCGSQKSCGKFPNVLDFSLEVSE